MSAGNSENISCKKPGGHVSLNGFVSSAQVSLGRNPPGLTSSPEGEVRHVPDQAFDVELQAEIGEIIELMLLIVLVVDRTEELGERFLLRGALGAGRGAGLAWRYCSRPWVLT